MFAWKFRSCEPSPESFISILTAQRGEFSAFSLPQHRKTAKPSRSLSSPPQRLERPQPAAEEDEQRHATRTVRHPSLLPRLCRCHLASFRARRSARSLACHGPVASVAAVLALLGRLSLLVPAAGRFPEPASQPASQPRKPARHIQALTHSLSLRSLVRSTCAIAVAFLARRRLVAHAGTTSQSDVSDAFNACPSLPRLTSPPRAPGLQFRLESKHCRRRRQHHRRHQHEQQEQQHQQAAFLTPPDCQSPALSLSLSRVLVTAVALSCLSRSTSTGTHASATTTLVRSVSACARALRL